MTEKPEVPTPPTPEVSASQAREATVRMFVLVHSLLADGLFPGKLSGRLTEARAFIETVHAEAMKQMEADPEYQARVKKEKENGNTEKGTPPQIPIN